MQYIKTYFETVLCFSANNDNGNPFLPRGGLSYRFRPGKYLYNFQNMISSAILL